MRETRVMTDGLRAAIERSGYYPGLVFDAVASALGSEPVTAFAVHHDAIFDPGMEVRRHMTVLALTPTRLVYSHTDEHPAEEPDTRPRAETSTEAIRFARISSVALTRVVPDPAAYVPGVTMPSEVMLTIGWNVLSHLELEPAHCGDESCEADHGYLGTITADDFSLRVSEAADGEEAVRQVLDFARALSNATASQGRLGPVLPLAPAQWHDVPANAEWHPRVANEDPRMTLEPKHPPIVPSYGVATLADLSASILASVEQESPDAGDPQPGSARPRNVLGLQPARRACLLIVDGLGWELLRDHPAVAPFLSELARNSKPITAGFPASTATSLGSIGTGCPPGQHGLLGYQVMIPGQDRLLTALRWDPRIDPVQWQPLPTLFERAVAAGIAPVHVARGSFRGNGLTAAAMRGADFWPADTMGALAAQTAAALSSHGRAFVVAYHGDLDATGHMFGVGSDAWYYQLAHVDKLAEQLARSLPSGTCLYVTADHGMVDVGAEDRIDVDAIPELRSGLHLLGGEARARHLYAQPGASGDVLAAWREVLGDRAWVLSRDEAIKEGWFGSVDARMADRIGDVVAAPVGNVAIVATKAEPRESALVGMHGSLTPSDQLVPALTFTAT